MRRTVDKLNALRLNHSVQGRPQHRLAILDSHFLPDRVSVCTAAADEQDDIVGQGNLIRTVAPEEISEELMPKLRELRLVKNCRELATNGWTVVRDAASLEFITRLRETTLRLVGNCGYGAGAVYSALNKDDVYAEAALNPKVAAMAEFSVGRGNLLNNLICT